VPSERHTQGIITYMITRPQWQ